ncbi:MAG: methylmalonyl-CoA mutase family protein [Betaproteobacteria bacterium]|nr:methylmalonyl-CoA mutase family protein [Betaproteobacteria bacterium]
MTDLSVQSASSDRRMSTRLRFVTAASLFDGHDASINIVRRLLQAEGAEVIHLGHNRSVEEIVTAAIDEDVHGIAVSSYQGGHLEFFRYMIDLLREQDASRIKVFGGGGGVIVPSEVAELHAYGVARIYSPEDGARLGLKGMAADMMRLAEVDLTQEVPNDLGALATGNRRALARVITALEAGTLPGPLYHELHERVRATGAPPVLGVTGTGGSGKSSLTDELVRRFRLDQNDALKLALLAVDPSRRKTGGALLGDRIRMNAIATPAVYMRSLATRGAGSEVAACLPDVLAACRVAGFDLVIVETSGIGQGDAAIAPLADVALYVMTPEYGAPSQLEKIDMLDFAHFVAINKFDRRGAQDALRDVSKQVQRNRSAFDRSPEEMPVFGTIAARTNDDGVTALFHALKDALREHGLKLKRGTLAGVAVRCSSSAAHTVPPARTRYLAEIAETVGAYHANARRQGKIARELQQLTETRRMLLESPSSPRRRGSNETASPDSALPRDDETLSDIDALIAAREAALDSRSKRLLELWPKMRETYAGDDYVVKIRGREVRTRLSQTTLSGTRVPKVTLPRYEDEGEILKWLLMENVPGSFPFTAGVFAFKRETEDPTRMFAGEGDPFRTNRRFKYLSRDSEAKRLSTAFDSVTLYGCDPHERPDIYGKIGNSGVSIATLDDLEALYDGFDLCHPLTSVSMTINGPAPAILAMFLNAAIDQQLDKFRRDNGREPTEDESGKIREWTLRTVRGTVQADILKEDQGQNTCIFSTEFALRMMGDIQEYFVHNQIRNFYSVSISGYHIAEAGANPVSQLAFTLANGFTYVESYLARGMHVDDFAPNLSFFFSNGMDAEYSVMGRVARRIWAVAMRDRYGANERSQKLKYHTQTSGRSLHAQEIDFNDIRTTLQALIGAYDNCNSQHTNAYDEAITTPTEESVRRAMAIQLIINREWGLAKNENPNQGSFIIDELTELVEEAVLKEFERIAERGGVLGAMETGYQRGKIQDESLHYETLKHDGRLPLVGVNTFVNPDPVSAGATIQLARSTEEEKQSQIRRLREFQERHRQESAPALARLQQAALANGNLFAELMNTVRVASLGQITQALFEVGGQYRRNM